MNTCISLKQLSYWTPSIIIWDKFKLINIHEIDCVIWCRTFFFDATNSLNRIENLYHNYNVQKLLLGGFYLYKTSTVLHFYVWATWNLSFLETFEHKKDKYFQPEIHSCRIHFTELMNNTLVSQGETIFFRAEVRKFRD